VKLDRHPGAAQSVRIDHVFFEEACRVSASRFVADSPLEENGFEPLVPLMLNQAYAGEREEIGAGIGQILSKSHPTSGGKRIRASGPGAAWPTVGGPECLARLRPAQWRVRLAADPTNLGDGSERKQP
jgi:hypothetical protein